MINRIFLGWDRPPLHVATEWLAQREASGGDFRRYLIVLPTSRAIRRLQELMAQEAASRSWPYYPPRMLTIGQLPERLYEPKRPFAESATQTLAWVRVLQEFDKERLAQVLGRLPERSDLRRWWALAELLQSMHRELASDRLDCQRVLDAVGDMGQDDERSRWEILVSLEQRYLQCLDDVGLWDRQTARLVALDRQEFATDQQLILIGLADLNRTTRDILDAVADAATALVFAPDAVADGFDAHGCLRPDFWHVYPIEIPDASWRIAESPLEAGYRVLAEMAGLLESDPGLGPHDVTVALPDESLLPVLQTLARSAGIQIDDAIGRPLDQTPLFHWMASVADWVTSRRFAALAELVRHPWMERWLSGQSELDVNVATLLDEYHGTFLPQTLGHRWPDVAAGADDSRLARRYGRLVRSMKRLVASIDRLLGELGATRPLDQWRTPIMERLDRLGLDQLDEATWASSQLADGLSHLEELFEGWQRVPTAWMPRVSGGELLQWVVHSAASIRPGRPVSDEAIEAVGWLEIPWDDGEAAIVCGFNEGLIPQAINADPFLPNRLRSRLGIDDNARRYARDAYAALLTMHAHRESRWISLRRSADGDPLRPSRLLFQPGQSKTARREADRILDFVRYESSLEVSLLRSGGTSCLDPPPPRKMRSADRDRLRSLHATAFRDYLTSPYYFYLRRVLGLSPIDDEQLEWDGGTFGNLAHRVLDTFGTSDLKSATDAEEIQRFLWDALDREVAALGVEQSVPTVALQLEQLRHRLDVWAERQAELATEGWEIVTTEVTGTWSFTERDVDFEVRGRIDRIDRHAERGVYRILDYKTSDSGASPEKTHRTREQWIDLQLPLYRLMIPKHLDVQVDDAVELGFFLLPKKLESIGVEIAEWSDTELVEAQQLARSIAWRIWNEEFDWSSDDTIPDHADDIAPILRKDMLA